MVLCNHHNPYDYVYVYILAYNTSLWCGQRNAIKSQICFDFCVSTILLKFG